MGADLVGQSAKVLGAKDALLGLGLAPMRVVEVPALAVPRPGVAREQMQVGLGVLAHQDGDVELFGLEEDSESVRHPS